MTARTVDDAKELALDRLGVVEDELEFEVVDEPRRGLFGIARGDARIRARVKPISREKPTDRKRRRRPNERTPSRWPGRPQWWLSAGGRSGGRSAERSGPAPRNGGRNGGGDDTDGPRGRRRRSPLIPGARAIRRAPREPAVRRRRRGGRGRAAAAAEPAAPVPGERDADERETRTSDDETQAEVDVETVPVAEQAEQAATFTDELVRTMGFSASVRTEIDGDDVTVHIEGDGLGALVGPKGATIQALQEVVRAVVQRQAGGHSAWIHVDVAGYRERRRQALEEFARQVAAEVKEIGEERALEPMNAADRKIVHDAIADFDGVDTTSEGEEPRRRVVVFPS